VTKQEFWKFIETQGKNLTVDSLQAAKTRIDRLIEQKVSRINALGVREGEKVMLLGASILEQGDDAPAIIAELKDTGVRVWLPHRDVPLGRFGYNRLRRLTDAEYDTAVATYEERRARLDPDGEW
jgi:hypothetical protein